MGNAVLIVDDEPGIRDTLRGVLEDEGFAVETVATGEACLEITRKKHFACILLDIWLGGGIDGLETLKQLREEVVRPQRTKKGQASTPSLVTQSIERTGGLAARPTSCRIIDGRSTSICGMGDTRCVCCRRRMGRAGTSNRWWDSADSCARR